MDSKEPEKQGPKRRLSVKNMMKYDFPFVQMFYIVCLIIAFGYVVLSFLFDFIFKEVRMFMGLYDSLFSFLMLFNCGGYFRLSWNRKFFTTFVALGTIQSISSTISSICCAAKVDIPKCETIPSNAVSIGFNFLLTLAYLISIGISFHVPQESSPKVVRKLFMEYFQDFAFLARYCYFGILFEISNIFKGNSVTDVSIFMVGNICVLSILVLEVRSLDFINVYHLILRGISVICVAIGTTSVFVFYIILTSSSIFPTNSFIYTAFSGVPCVISIITLMTTYYFYHSPKYRKSYLGSMEVKGSQFYTKNVVDVDIPNTPPPTRGSFASSIVPLTSTINNNNNSSHTIPVPSNSGDLV